MKYNIIDDTKAYWCYSGYGFWSRFEGSKNVRVQYNILTGYLQILFMKILGKDMKVKLVRVMGAEVQDGKEM